MHEVVTTLLEVESVRAAGMRLKKPIKVPRPKRDRNGSVRGEVARDAHSTAETGVRRVVGVLAASARPRGGG